MKLFAVFLVRCLLAVSSALADDGLGDCGAKVIKKMTGILSAVSTAAAGQ